MSPSWKTTWILTAAAAALLVATGVGRADHDDEARPPCGAAHVVVEAPEEPQFELTRHTAEQTVVFDRRTGRVHVVAGEALTVIDPVAGKVTTGRVQTAREVGTVIPAPR